MNIAKNTVKIWSVILIALAAMFVLEMVPENPISLINYIPGTWHTLALSVFGVTLIAEAKFGKGGLEKKPGDIFMVLMGLVAFILAFSVMGMIEVPVVLSGYMIGVYVFLVIALIYAFKAK